MTADVDTYTQEQYEAMEKELSDALLKVLDNFKNKYCVQPILSVAETNKISVFIINKAQHNPFKG